MTTPCDFSHYAFETAPHTPEHTRAAMHSAGLMLGSKVDVGAFGQVCVVCSAQDADHLARGVIDALVAQHQGSKIRLLCTWSEPVQTAELNLHCIVKQYCEPLDPVPTLVVVLAGFWREGSAGLTNLLRALSCAKAERVVVAAPVMDGQALSRTLDDLPQALRGAAQPLYATLYPQMTASERERMLEVEKSLYACLGFGQPNGATKYIPTLVRQRRELLRSPR